MKKIIINKEDFVEFSLYVFIAYVMLPSVSVILPPYIRTLVILFILFSIFVGTTFQYQRNSGSMMILHCAMISVITICYFGKTIFTYSDYISYFTSSYLFWGAIAFSYSIRRWNTKRKNRVYNFLLFTMVITMITTIVGNIMYPQASRVLADISRDFANHYLRLNIGTYGFIYGLVIMLPFFWGKSKTNKKYLILIVLTFIVLLVSQYSIAMLVATFISLSILFVPDGKLAKMIFFWLMVCLIFSIVRPLLYLSLLDVKDIFDTIGLEMLSDRFDAVIDLMINNDLSGSALVRYELYMKSWETFISKPIFGNVFTNTMNVLGGHSEILDVLAAGGLSTSALCVGILLPHIRKIGRKKNSDIYTYMRYSFMAFLIVAFVNTIFVSGIIAVISFLVPELLDVETN